MKYLGFVGCFVLLACSAPAQTPLKTVNSPEGGRIMYGVVDGASGLAGGMASVLRAVHSGCGERPQVGKPFRFRGTQTEAVFFTVVNHAAGNAKVAGLVLAAFNGSGQVEAALVSDDAKRFGTTVNPMLKELFSEWHPGGAVAAASASTGKTVASSSVSAGGGGVTIPPMRQVTLPDGTGTVNLPVGWNVVPNQSGMAVMNVTGPQGELLGLNLYYLAWDPYNPSVQNRLRMGIRFPNEIDYPTNADLTKSFADILQRIRASQGQGPAPLELASVQPASGAQGQCVTATGQFNPDGTTMRDLQALLCRSTPNQNGQYFFTFTKRLLPLGATDQQRATANAIIASYKPDMQRAEAIASAQAGPIIAQMQQVYQAHQQALMSFTQQQIMHTQQIGADATARMNAAEQMHDMQNQSFEEHEDAISRNGEGFSNYLLDQTVVQDNNMYNNGTIGHGTVWNSTADALVKANPSRFEIVDTPNYWRGVDY